MTRFTILTAGITIIAAGCFESPVGNTCVGKSEDDLHRIAHDESCDILRIEETSLTDLTGLEEITHRMNIEIVGNPNLVDVSAIQELRGIVLLAENESLVDAKLGKIAAGVFVGERPEFLPVLKRLSFTATADLRPTVRIDQRSPSGASLESVHVGCEGDCLPVSLRVRGTSFSAALELESGYSSLGVEIPDVDLATLQGLLVPTTLVSLTLAPRSLAEEYLSWLRSEGFAGTFDACVYDGPEAPSACTNEMHLTEYAPSEP